MKRINWIPVYFFIVSFSVTSALHRFAPLSNSIFQSSVRAPKLIHRTSISTTHLNVALSNDDFRSEKDKQVELTLSTPVRYSPLHMKFKGKILTLWGIFYAAIILTCSLISLPLMMVFTALAELAGNGKRRRLNDWVVHWWAKLSLLLAGCRPRLLGASLLPPPGQTVVYVPNHTSYFDILLLSGFVPRPFKYLSKSEILDIPVVGTGMRLAKHVFLKRNDIRSTIEVADTCVQRLQDGNSMVLFAEGTRSLDGTLKKFKKGAFQMAKAAGVPVVPVSIGNLHRWMPPFSILPLAPIRHTYIKVHPAIDTTNKSVREIKKLCFEAVNSGLPQYQQYNGAKDAKETDE